MGGLQLGRVALIAGPALNVLTAWDGKDLDLAIFPESVTRSGATTVRIFPGFLAGVQGL